MTLKFRPPISKVMKREVRQRCFFGCVICGMPVYQYDHILPYAVIREHGVDNITLLCPNHHADKTAGRLSAGRVAHCTKNPFNRNRDWTAGFLIQPSKSFDINIGANELGLGHGAPLDLEYPLIWLSGHCYAMLHRENGWITFSIKVTDRLGSILLLVERGEMTVTTKTWDYLYEGSRLQIRDAPGKIIIDLDINNAGIFIRRGNIVDIRDGSGFEISRTKVDIIDKGLHKGSYKKLTSIGNTGGSFGLLDPELFDIRQKPIGFGCFYTSAATNCGGNNERPTSSALK